MKRLKVLTATLLIFGLCACSTAPKESEKKMEEQTTTILSKRNTDIHITLTTPAQKAENGYPLVVMAHGFMGNRDESGNFSGVATMLAEHGIASIRMDFPGCNDSEESYLNYTLENMQHDVTSSLDYALQQLDIDESRIGMLGYSMGGRVASLYLDQASIDTLVLWAPAGSDSLSAMKYMGSEEEIEEKLKAAETDGKAMIQIWGNDVEVSYDYLKQMKEAKPTESLQRFHGDALIVTGGLDKVVTSDISDAVIAACTNTSITAHLEIPAADHSFGVGYSENEAIHQLIVESTSNFFIDHL